MDETTVYRFSCKACGAPIAAAKNAENSYACPYCEAQHAVAADDQDAQLEELTFDELNSLQMTIGVDMMRATAAADMPTTARLGILMQKLQQVTLRYSNKDANELDQALQAQFAERRRRIAAGEVSGDKLVYTFSCARCGAPINHKPVSDFEEIHCPTCGERVSFDKSQAQAGDGTQAAMSNEEKAARMQELAAQLQQAQAAGDVANAQRLQQEYMDLSNSYAMSFDYAAHQEIYDDVADRLGGTLEAGARATEIYQEISELDAEIEQLGDQLRVTADPGQRQSLEARWGEVHARKAQLEAEFEEVNAAANAPVPTSAEDDAAFAAQQAQEAEYELAAFEAAARNDFEAVQAILTNLQAGVSANIEDAEERSLIGYFVAHNNVQAVDWMLRHGLAQSDVLANEYECRKSEVRRTIIFTAIDRGFTELVGLLLQAGAELDAEDATRQDCTPLHAAVSRGDPAMVRAFVQRIQATKQGGQANIDGMGLMQALLAKNLEAVFDSDEIDPTDERDNTPLHYAAWGGNQEIVQLLVDAGADVEAENESEQTPAALAQAGGHAAVVSYLQSRA